MSTWGYRAAYFTTWTKCQRAAKPAATTTHFCLLTTKTVLTNLSRVKRVSINSEQVKIYENQILMIKFTQCTRTLQSQVDSKGQGCQHPEAIFDPHTLDKPSLKHYSKETPTVHM